MATFDFGYTDRDRPHRNTNGTGCVATVLLGIAVLVVVGFALTRIVERSFSRPLPGANAEKKLLEHEDMASFTPPHARLINKWAAGAANVQAFGGSGSEHPTTVGRNWRLAGSRGGAMRSYVAPALRDRWNLVNVACSTTAGTSKIVFTKRNGWELLTITTERADHYLAAVLSVPRDVPYQNPPGGNSDPKDLIDTGVSRTDPGCVDARAPTPFVGPNGVWSGQQVCALIAQAWPGALNLDPEGEFCWLNIDGIHVSADAVATDSGSYYRNQRLTTAGDDTRFALLGGGFWTLRSDVAIVVIPRQPAAENPNASTLLESRWLELANAVQRATPN